MQRSNFLLLLIGSVFGLISFTWPLYLPDSEFPLFQPDNARILALLIALIAVILITIGYSKSKRAKTATEKFKPIKIFYLIGLIIILASIPWPFRANLGGAWF
ncbi:MAG: hypothetical protein RJB59_892 [Actinomycetota bacterium]